MSFSCRLEPMGPFPFPVTGLVPLLRHIKRSDPVGSSQQARREIPWPDMSHIAKSHCHVGNVTLWSQVAILHEVTTKNRVTLPHCHTSLDRMSPWTPGSCPECGDR